MFGRVFRLALERSVRRAFWRLFAIDDGAVINDTTSAMANPPIKTATGVFLKVLMRASKRDGSEYV